MGSRGARSGISDVGKEYGTEYDTILKYQNIKFVKYKDSKSAKSPMETMSKGRIYVTVNGQNELVYITYYDSDGKRKRQIDLNHYHEIDGKKEKPHIHNGYEHDENGSERLGDKEKKIVDKINYIWEYYK